MVSPPPLQLSQDEGPRALAGGDPAQGAHQAEGKGPRPSLCSGSPTLSTTNPLAPLILPLLQNHTQPRRHQSGPLAFKSLFFLFSPPLHSSERFPREQQHLAVEWGDAQEGNHRLSVALAQPQQREQKPISEKEQNCPPSSKDRALPRRAAAVGGLRKQQREYLVGL